MSARGISLDELRTAFGEEFEIVGDWPADAQWPTLLAALPVNDAARGRKIAEALTSVEIAGTAWTRSDKNGATLYSLRPFGGFVPVCPTIAVSEKMMIAGSDTGAVETALSRVAQPAGELEKSAIFRDAVGQVPPAESAFNYVDTRLFYERADAAARPLLLMGAALYPALAQTIDFSNWPAPEAIAKHLSPIVMSQRYDRRWLCDGIGRSGDFPGSDDWIGGRGRRLVYLSAGRTKEPRSVADGPNKSRNGPC